MEPFETSSTQTSPQSAAPLPRMWPGLLLVGLFWAAVASLRLFDAVISTNFVVTMGSSVLLALVFSVWWLTNRRVDISERFFDWFALVAGAVITGYLCHPSIGWMGIFFFGLPFAITLWAIWLVLSKRWAPGTRRAGVVALMVLVWGLQLAARVDGIDGDNNAQLSLRWHPTAEDLYVRQRPAQSPDAATAESGPVSLQNGDWAEFRGPSSQSTWHGPAIATDWNEHPPKELWRRKIGPAWSSVLVVDGRLYTQEQRGDSEALVALDAGSGREIWAHEDKVRFSDGQAGAGPRATPTFSDGRLYSYGATGVLNAVDAATGKLVWTRDAVADSKAPLPMWGFSSSPLVTDGLVIVFAGGPGDKGLLAYKTDDGELAWTAETGAISYSSAQLAAIDGVPQILFFSDAGLEALAPNSGKLLWKFDAPANGIWRVDQPRQLKDGAVLIGCEDLGLLRIEVEHANDTWTPSEAWRSRAIRPAYNDFVVDDDTVYGFDEAIFCAVDAQTGKRLWKAGRYGHGQVLLLADQDLLLVITEGGEAVLVKADPKRHEELGRFQAVTGKTWNHPVIAHGRLYVRNDQELACFELAEQSSVAAAAGPSDSTSRAIAER